MKRTTQEGLLNVYIFVLKNKKQNSRHREKKRKGKSNQTKWQKGQESGAKVENKKVVKTQ